MCHPVEFTQTTSISGPLLRRPSPGPKPDLPAKPDLRQRAAKKRLLILGSDDDKVPGNSHGPVQVSPLRPQNLTKINKFITTKRVTP